MFFVPLITETRDTEDLKRLKVFADAVKTMASQQPLKFGRYKVFLCALGLSKTTARMLVEAHREGFLRLSRADLIPAMDPSLISASEINYAGIAEFHLIDLE